MEKKLTETERDREIKALHKDKSDLLDKYGVFGGGTFVNSVHQGINMKLEQLGVMEYNTLSYDEYLNI